tara:strand:- start:1334 stop:1771 length:438 start_codon:yes stop_codon:yes gene_type:complete
MKKTKNLLNPTKAQIKYRNRLWSAALRKNKKKATSCMYDEVGGRCCLAVAQDVAIQQGVHIPDDELDAGYEDKESYPHENVEKFFGWDSFTPTLLTSNAGGDSAPDLNDAVRFSNGVKEWGMTHKRIAECVDNTFVHPKNPKWTF